MTGALLLVAIGRFGPRQMTFLHEAPLPLPARLLYGGITEELLVRWGVMTGLLWLWRRCVPSSARVDTLGAAVAIAASALLFGAAHLPGAVALIGVLDASTVVAIVCGNALFGIVAGSLYWRRGLEAAIGMHVLSHAFAALAGG